MTAGRSVETVQVAEPNDGNAMSMVAGSPPTSSPSRRLRRPATVRSRSCRPTTVVTPCAGSTGLRIDRRAEIRVVVDVDEPRRQDEPFTVDQSSGGSVAGTCPRDPCDGTRRDAHRRDEPGRARPVDHGDGLDEEVEVRGHRPMLAARQEHLERRAPAVPGLEPRASPVQFGEPANQGQAHAAPASVPTTNPAPDGTARTASEVVGNAGARHRRRASGRRPGSKPTGTGAGRRADRVRQQVSMMRSTLAASTDTVTASTSTSTRGPRGLRVRRRCAPPGPRVGRTSLWRHDAALESIEVEQVRQQAFELPGVGGHAPDQVERFGLGQFEPGLLQGQGRTQDRRERGPEVVGPRLKERVLHVIECAEALGRLPFSPERLEYRLALAQGRSARLRSVTSTMSPRSCFGPWAPRTTCTRSRSHSVLCPG